MSKICRRSVILILVMYGIYRMIIAQLGDFEYHFCDVGCVSVSCN